MVIFLIMIFWKDKAKKMDIRNMFVQKLLDKDLARQMGMTEKEFKLLCKTAEGVDEESAPWEVKLAIDKIKEINSKAFAYTFEDYIEDCLEYSRQSEGYMYDDWDIKSQLQSEVNDCCPFDLTWAWKGSYFYVMGNARKHFIQGLVTDFEVAVEELIDEPDDFVRIMRTFRRFF